jgi:hypothetical protein
MSGLRGPRAPKRDIPTCGEKWTKRYMLTRQENAARDKNGFAKDHIAALQCRRAGAYTPVARGTRP